MRVLIQQVPFSVHYTFPLLTGFQYANDQDIGVAVIDSYTHYVLQFMEAINKTSQKTMRDLVSSVAFHFPRFFWRFSIQFDSYDVNKIGSHPGVRDDLFKRPLDQTLITDFFGNLKWHRDDKLIHPPRSRGPHYIRRCQGWVLTDGETLEHGLPCSSSQCSLDGRAGEENRFDQVRLCGFVVLVTLIIICRRQPPCASFRKWILVIETDGNTQS